MQIKRLELSNFRNLEEQTVSFASNVTLVVGDNGQGKTSLLEAIHLLSHAKSFRTSKLSELVRWAPAKGQKALSDCRVSAVVSAEEGTRSVTWQLQRGKREVLVNDKKVKDAQSFYGQLTSVLFTPEDLQLVKASPALRRTYLDRILAMVDRSYVENIVGYQRALRQRNALLISAKRSPQSLSADAITTWNMLLVRYGKVVAAKRQQLREEISPAFKEYYRALAEKSAGEATEEVDCRYVSEFISQGAVREDQDLLDEYASNQPRDLRQSLTMVGVHRDDLHLSLNSGFGLKAARRSASQGQARSLALSLKLAAVRYLGEHTGEAPAVLLDDVESELDSGRRSQLYRLLAELGCQVIVTATDISQSFSNQFSTPEILEVRAGKILLRQTP